jgi:hypothetical protein
LSDRTKFAFMLEALALVDERKIRVVGPEHSTLVVDVRDVSNVDRQSFVTAVGLGSPSRSARLKKRAFVLSKETSRVKSM